MFASGRSKRLRGVDYERVLKAVAVLHGEDRACGEGFRFWSDGPVRGFAGRLIAALEAVVEDASFGSISWMPDVGTREYKVIASARLKSREQTVVQGLNAKLAEMIRGHEGYRRMQDAVMGGHVCSDAEVMGRAAVMSSCAWREIYRVRDVGFSSVFLMPGVVRPYWVAVFRNETPVSGREVAMLGLLREQLLKMPGGMRRVEEVGGVLGDGAAARLRGLGLRPAEAEVMRWVCEGKRDGEIAVILGKSVRTVHAQMRAAFVTLGVETRTAAARVAMEYLREGW